jgi:hypothetical protein
MDRRSRLTVWFGTAVGLALLLFALLPPHLVPAYIPAAWLAGMAVGFLLRWSVRRGAVREAFGGPYALEWTDAAPPPEEAAGEWHAELQRLCYRPAGALRRQEPARTGYVYIHEALPIYVLASPAGGLQDDEPRVLQFESFFDDGARVTTTTSMGYACVAPMLKTPPPHLVQLREGGTPTALDGQHVGTVKAWMAGGREALPASKEALIGYLAQDRQRLQACLEEAGWLPLGAYARGLLGDPPGVLRF